MKKTTIFISAILACSICLLSTIFFIVRQADFSIQTIQGNPVVLQEVSIDTASAFNYSHISINYHQNDTNYALFTYPYAFDNRYSELICLSNEDTKAISDWKNTKDNEYSLTLDFTDIYYGFNYNDDRGMGYIKTDMRYETDDTTTVKLTREYDEENIPLYDNIQTYNQNNEVISDTPIVLPIYYKGYYYVLPPANKYMKGQNYIYKGKPSDQIETFFISSFDDSMQDSLLNANIETEKIAKVAMGRDYLQMFIVNEQFYVFSTLDNTLYITVYDLDGTYINEWKYENQSMGTAFQNDHYICFESQNKLFVLDTENMKIEEKGSIPDTEFYSLSDLYYHNQKLYISYIKINGNSQTGNLLVYENNQLLYQGRIDYAQQKDSPYNTYGTLYLTDINFRR